MNFDSFIKKRTLFKNPLISLLFKRLIIQNNIFLWHKWMRIISFFVVIIALKRNEVWYSRSIFKLININHWTTVPKCWLVENDLLASKIFIASKPFPQPKNPFGFYIQTYFTICFRNCFVISSRTALVTTARWSSFYS